MKGKDPHTIFQDQPMIGSIAGSELTKQSQSTIPSCSNRKEEERRKVEEREGGKEKGRKEKRKEGVEKGRKEKNEWKRQKTRGKEKRDRRKQSKEDRKL